LTKLQFLPFCPIIGSCPLKVHTKDIIPLLKKNDYSIYFLSFKYLTVIFNKEYIFNNNFKIYLLQILEKLIIMYLKQNLSFFEEYYYIISL